MAQPQGSHPVSFAGLSKAPLLEPGNGNKLARIRTIKPDFFRHEALFEAEIHFNLPLRVAFAGLWTAADRDGRFKWKPRQLKLDCLPFDDVDFSRVLDALESRGFVVRYADAEGSEYGCIPSWSTHQIINNRESESVLPDPEECSIKSTTSTREPRVIDATATPLVHAQGEGKGKERKGSDKNSPPEGVDQKVWDDFRNLRKAKKAPITQTAVDGIRREAEIAGFTLNQALATCCERGWQGFKADWVGGQAKAPPSGGLLPGAI